MASIPWWHQEIVEIVCMFEKEIPMSFMDLEVHILIHLPNEAELARVLSCHWIFFLERYMKKLKGFFQQRKKPKGSMEEGYIVYELLYYASEYIKKIDDKEEIVIQDDHQYEDKREGELLQTNEKMHLIKSQLVIFCRFSIKKLFTLNLIICFSTHAIYFEFFFTSTNSKILMSSINSFFKLITYI
jgi:hypothetical protein